jgi:hypothetical protein
VATTNSNVANSQQQVGGSKPCQKQKAIPKVVLAAPKVALVPKQGALAPGRLKLTVSITDEQAAALVFDGKATLTTTKGNLIKIFDQNQNGQEIHLPHDFTALQLQATTADLWVEAVAASAAVEDVEIGLELTKTGQIDVGAPAKCSDKMTSLELTLDICPCRSDLNAKPDPLDANAKINVGRNLHLQKNDWAARARLLVKRAKPVAYTGKLILKPIDNRVGLFSQEVSANNQVAVVTPVSLTNDTVPDDGQGQEYWVQGTAASGALRDTGFTLELEDLPNQAGDKVAVTVFELKLDICQSRTAPNVDPVALDAVSKLDPGRFVQKSNGGYHYGRAKLIVHPPVPAGYTGHLDLNALDAKVQAFAQGDEIPANGQNAVATSNAAYDIDAAAIPQNGLVLWAEGTTVSAALHDTGFRLKLRDATDGGHNPNDGDKVMMTVAELTKIKATIKATPPNTVRQGVALPAAHDYESTALDPDFAANPPLVLMRNAQPDIALVATATPANLPIRWAAVRNPLDDGSLGTAVDLPTVTPDNNPLKATLSADNQGSFRVRAYIDCNGNNAYNEGEPSVPLNLVLAAVTFVADNSAALNNNLVAQGVNGGALVKNGTWPNSWVLATGANGAGMTMELVANVTGGGADGRLGLEKVFGGLINMLVDDRIQVVYRDSTGQVAQDYTVKNVYVSNGNQASALYGNTSMFLPTDPLPIEYAFPHLDTGRDPGGVGGETAVMGRSGVWDPVPANQQVGKQYTLRCIDSPGRGFYRVHPTHPQALLFQIHYEQRFKANFCFWTNVTQGRAATGDPADRVYSVVRTMTWSVDGDWDVDSTQAVPVLTNTVAHVLAVQNPTTIAPIGRAQDHAVEVRPPSGITTGIAWETT